MKPPLPVRATTGCSGAVTLAPRATRNLRPTMPGVTNISAPTRWRPTASHHVIFTSYRSHGLPIGGCGRLDLWWTTVPGTLTQEPQDSGFVSAFLVAACPFARTLFQSERQCQARTSMRPSSAMLHHRAWLDVSVRGASPSPARASPALTPLYWGTTWALSPVMVSAL
jgi:hypothetical protein